MSKKRRFCSLLKWNRLSLSAFVYSTSILTSCYNCYNIFNLSHISIPWVRTKKVACVPQVRLAACQSSRSRWIMPCSSSCESQDHVAPSCASWMFFFLEKSIVNAKSRRTRKRGARLGASYFKKALLAKKIA